MNVFAIAVTVLLAAGTADQLVSARVKEVKLKVPAAWKAKNDGTTRKFIAPSGDAEFALDVFPLPAPLDPAICVDKLTKALGGKDWEKLTIGGSPAARSLQMDDSDQKKNAFQSRIFVGCNGKVKWAMTFALSSGKVERFGPLSDEVAQSLEYVKATGKK